MSAAQQFQVAIVGGGIVGSTLALALSRQGIKTVLLEKKATVLYTAGQSYGLRVSAISLASEYLFRNLRIWDEIIAVRVSPYKQMHVWDACGTGVLHFDSTELQQQQLGYIVENDLLQSVLLKHLQQQKACTLINPADIQAINFGTRNVVLKLKQQHDITAQLIVGADGAESKVRELAAIGIESRRYRQCGLVCVIKTAQSHQNTAWQRFLPGGPLALLPLKDAHCSIVWSLPDAEAERLLNLDEQAFCNELTEASESCLGDVLSCGPRALFPLHYQQAKNYVKARLALIGDAAHVVHPLAGQGVNLGLLDAAELGQLLFKKNSHNTDMGSLKLLRRYERSRRSENVIMGLAFDLLNHLYGSEMETVKRARNLGMQAVNRSSWLKRFFMQRATGLEQALHMHHQADNTTLLTPPEFQGNTLLNNRTGET
jgi:2-octaprenylphenol hydroxylase